MNMNSNLFHNILNVAMALCAVALLPEFHAILPAEVALTVASAAATVKLVVNVLRDGVSGLTKPQPPVQK